MPIRYEDTSVDCEVAGDVDKLCGEQVFINRGFSVDSKIRFSYDGNKYKISHNLQAVPKYVTAIEFWYSNGVPYATVYYRDAMRFSVNL